MVPVDQLTVEVVYALPQQQALLTVVMPVGATVEQAIQRSGLLAMFPDIDLATCRVGVFGKLCRLLEPVCDGDRIEIYRPLVIDPKESRRRRADGDSR